MDEDKTKFIKEELERRWGESYISDLVDGLDKKPEPIYWETLDNMSFPDDRWLIKDILPKEGV